MIVVIDTRVLPPAVTLEEADDFTAFKTIVRTAEHVWIAPEALSVIAGARTEDTAWREGLAGMAGDAQRAGWTDDRGRIRAHVEVNR